MAHRTPGFHSLSTWSDSPSAMGTNTRPQSAPPASSAARDSPRYLWAFASPLTWCCLVLPLGAHSSLVTAPPGPSACLSTLVVGRQTLPRGSSVPQSLLLLPHTPGANHKPLVTSLGPTVSLWRRPGRGARGKPCRLRLLQIQVNFHRVLTAA